MARLPVRLLRRVTVARFMDRVSDMMPSTRSRVWDKFRASPITRLISKRTRSSSSVTCCLMLG